MRGFTVASFSVFKKDANVGISKFRWHKFCHPDMIEDC